MGPGNRHSRLGAAAIAAVAATLLFAAWMAWNIGGESTTRHVSDLATPLAALAASLSCRRAGVSLEGRLRGFWWLLAGACASWTLGEVLWACYDLSPSADVPVPSWADVGYLSAVPLAIAALLAHPAVHCGRGWKVRSLLDSLSVATALLLLSWTSVLGPLWQSSDLTTLGGAVALAYPFGDVLVIFLVLLTIRGMRGGGRIALWCLLGGLLAMALSDSAYSYLVEVRGYETGNLLDTGWFVGYLGIALGARYASAHGSVRHRTKASPAFGSLAASFLPVLVALTVIGVEIQLGHRLDDPALVMACALVLLALTRQAVLLADVVAGHGDQEISTMRRLPGIASGRTLSADAEPSSLSPPRGSPA